MRIRAYATLQEVVGGSVLDRDLPGGATVGEILRILAEEHPGLGDKLWDEKGNLRGYINVLLNGRSIEYLQGELTPVKAADTLSLFPPVGGGC